MSRGGYAHPPCKMGHLVTTTRVLACSAVLGWGFALGMGGCVPMSPIVGEEGSGADAGSVELIGSASYFTRTMTVADPQDLPTTCLPRKLPLSVDGAVTCSVHSVRLPAGGECVCDGTARRASLPIVRGFIDDELEMSALCGGSSSRDCADYCVCEELPATDASLDDCLNSPTPADSSVGWCYLDPDHGRGSSDLVARCPDTQRQLLRVLPDEVTAGPGVVWIVGCTGGPVIPGPTAPGPGSVGTPCFPGAERTHDFNGFALSEVGFEFGSPECASNTCLINHVQGRASCPYGQTAEEAANAPECFRPEPDGQVTVPVDPQLLERRSDENAICSCRCGGADPSKSYCECPDDMVCSRLVPSVGVPGEEAYVGSYCIHPGTRYDPTHPPSSEACDRTLMNCGDPHPY